MTNLKLVLKVYTAYRQMSPDDIALLETLRALNDGDRELMVETLQGKATAKKAGKKSSTSKSSQPSSKSPRASGMAAQLKSRVNEQRETPKTSTAIDDMTMEIVERCTDCGAVSDDNVHHKRTDPNYHPFVPSTTAPPAPASSPANGGAGSGTVNSGTLTDSAGVVAHEASEGD